MFQFTRKIPIPPRAMFKDLKGRDVDLLKAKLDMLRFPNLPEDLFKQLQAVDLNKPDAGARLSETSCLVFWHFHDTKGDVVGWQRRMEPVKDFPCHPRYSCG